MLKHKLRQEKHIKGKFIAWNEYIRKEDRFQINNLSAYLRKLDKEQQIESKVKRKKEIIIRATIN